VNRLLFVAILPICTLLAGGFPVVSPDDALSRLREGNAAWVAGRLDPAKMTGSRRVELAAGEHPFAAILSCADSRVPPEYVFSQGLGDLFLVRVAGAVAEPGAIGSLEYAVENLGVTLVVVMGHTSCGAVKAAMEMNPLVHPTASQVNLESLLSMIRPALARASPAGDPWTAAVRASVDQTTRDLRAHSPVLEDMVRSGKVRIVGAVYDLETGKVTFGNSLSTAATREPETGRPDPRAVVE
jgi:carbonic anhydrase